MAPLGLRPLLLATVVLSLATLGSCGVNITSLPRSIVVSTRINGMEITESSQLMYNHDNLTVAWHLNETFLGQDSSYKKVVIKLCFSAASAKGRPWRAANTDLSKSKTCLSTNIAAQPYTINGSSALNYDSMGHRPQWNESLVNATGNESLVNATGNESLVNATGNVTVWKAPLATPGASYFVRVFVLNSTSSDATPANSAVAMGQTTDANMTTNTFQVVPYSGVTSSLIITVCCLSLGSYALLFGVFFAERMIKKNK